MSAKFFDPSPELIAELRRAQLIAGTEDAITRAYDAFLLDPGLGPPTYLASNGTVLWDDDIWNVVPTIGAACAA